MLKTTSASGPKDENIDQGDQKIQLDDQDEKELTQKSYKGQ